jgi:hypothetical protein
MPIPFVALLKILNVSNFQNQTDTNYYIIYIIYMHSIPVSAPSDGNFVHGHIQTKTSAGYFFNKSCYSEQIHILNHKYK